MNRVSYLINCNFSSLSLEDKLKIKELGRPMPDLPHLFQETERKAENRTFTRRFTRDMYYKNSWICGCEVTNLLYCFPCLLFYVAGSGGVDIRWARQGIKDLQQLSIIIKKHENSLGHINSFIDLALLGKSNISTQSSSAYRHILLKHNHEVRKNRHILMKIISCVKFCAAFELAFRDDNESKDSMNKSLFKELMNFTAELDVTLKEHLHNSTAFKGTSKIIQDDVLESMLCVCREEISNQIEQSQFVSVQCDETTDLSNTCQMVIILRYIFQGSLREHFWGFVKATDRSATGLKMCIEKEIDPILLKTPQKLIAQTYDSANIMSDSTNGVHAQIKLKYPNAHFIHCYAHQLNLIVQKAASQYPKVRVFFNNLSAIPAFFSNSAHHCDIIQEIVNRKFARMATTKWNYNIHTVNIIYGHREKLIQVFEEIEDKCEKSVTSNEASGLRRALQDSEFLFWLTLFNKIMPHVHILYNQLQSKNSQIVELEKYLSVFESSIAKIKNETENIKAGIESIFEGPKKRKADNDLESNIAKEVCDTIVSQMKDRFSYQGHLQAAELFNKDACPRYNKNLPFILNSVCTFYPMLSKTRLETELEVIYSRPDFTEIVGAMNILSFIRENDLGEIFAETVKLLNIIVTTPMTTAETDRKFPTLERIKTFLQTTMLNERLNALAIMSINRTLVMEIDNFDEKVMEKFIHMKDRLADFTFKK